MGGIARRMLDQKEHWLISPQLLIGALKEERRPLKEDVGSLILLKGKCFLKVELNIGHVQPRLSPSPPPWALCAKP